MTNNDRLVAKFGTVAQEDYASLAPFVRQHHYSHTTNGLTGVIAFSLRHQGRLVGVALFGTPGMRGVAQKYCPGCPGALIELRRLVLLDDTPKNAESYFVSRCFAWLRQNTGYKRILSYADPTFGHTGIIYRALNFQEMGRTTAKKILQVDGRIIQYRVLHQPRPIAAELRQRLAAGDPDIVIRRTEPKYIYVLDLY